MRFGHFFYPMKFDDSNDAAAIGECLAEAELVESLGFDAIWLAEHYFTGECVYGDPLVFAAALAVKTSRVDLGFGILELPLHNPVRVAIQTALLDNLCQGRLIVGTAKGSNYNAYEYIGFGTNPQQGAAQLEEAEDLLIKAWTTDDGLEFKGQYYQATFPSLRPRPWQKPHPRLARACLNAESVQEMGRIGRPVLLRGRSTAATAASIRLYREAMAAAGFAAADIERRVSQIWVWRELHLAPTDDQAMDEFLPAQYDAFTKMQAYRAQWNPPEYPMERQTPPLLRAGYAQTPDPEAAENLVGSPARVAEQIYQMQAAGIPNLMLTNRGLMPPEKTATSLKLFSEQVMPLFHP